ncbi:hypothetical protein J4573_16365 [Actinomadura barringtoniae]|uniref:Uncharacterized protein n=1 Tax=Actinomadura barringtoniae TaxID=1427535 RepID=A0A939P9L0_9ACTN|nr:hypothetical protein [Actinomadura barringtoniae]MBO2448677.1 hypothetical protein [Actinomadura barringtoniae]
MTTWRAFVMLAWEPKFGAYVYPVGVFGVTAGAAAVLGEPYVSWVPMTYERGLSWRRRLANPITEELVQDWADRGQLTEVPLLAGSAEAVLAETVETLLNGLLIEVLPVFHERRAK